MVSSKRTFFAASTGVHVMRGGYSKFQISKEDNALLPLDVYTITGGLEVLVCWLYNKIYCT